MNEYQLDPNVCPSSLNEDGEPMTEGETAHRWDYTNDPVTCAECGAEKEMLPDGELLDLLYAELDKKASLEETAQKIITLLSENRND